tara:strand:+ start:651 stop:1343 length:693 start_codon:yes stop_codon:yes gene_type:complete
MEKLSKFFINFIANSKFLQYLASKFVLIIPGVLTHNLSKYFLIKNVIQTLSMDQIKGDYAEFGCFTGSCLRHSARCFKKYFNNIEIKIYGFDSFEGFPEEVHKTFKSKDFKVSYEKVKELENSGQNIKIVKGFFDKSLEDENLKKDLKEISFAFIDCDLATSSKSVFNFIANRLSNGAFIMIDDYFNIDINNNSIQNEFLKYFEINKNVFIYKYFGLSGVCFRYKKINSN